MAIRAFIFDLDGVLVDTAKYHFNAWQRLANSIGVDFTIEDNEKLKGLSREDSFDLILKWGNKSMPAEEKQEKMLLKNDWYLEMVKAMDASEILPGISAFMDEAREMGIKMALGSASRNAPLILEKTGLIQYFEAVIDGNQTTKSKPDPQVFLLGAKALGVNPQEAVVFEDSEAGIEAAITGGFKTVGIGIPENLPKAEILFTNLENITPKQIISKLTP